MGTRDPEQPPLWIAASDLPVSPGHPFYTRLNALLDADGFDTFVEDACRSFCAPVLSRPRLAVRSFLRLGLEEAAPDHSTISRTRRVIDVETHRAVFTWVQQRLAAAGLLKIAIDATTLEANAAMRSIVRRDTGEAYQAYLPRLAAASGIKTPRREVLARFDRTRKKQTSNSEWTSPSDPDAKVAKIKDGHTHLAHKAEHAVDLESGAVVAVTVQGVVARIVTDPHEAHRQDPHLPMRYDTGRPRTASLPCPAGLRARRPSPIMDLYRKNVFSTRP